MDQYSQASLPMVDSFMCNVQCQILLLSGETLQDEDLHDNRPYLGLLDSAAQASCAPLLQDASCKRLLKCRKRFTTKPRVAVKKPGTSAYQEA